MNRSLVRFVAALLSVTIIAADPSWAANFAEGVRGTHGHIPAPLAVWSQQALIQPLVDGFGGRKSSYRLRRDEKILGNPTGSTRREWAGSIVRGFAGFFLVLGIGSAQTYSETPSLEDARRYRNLLPRLIDTSPALRAALEKIRAAQDHLEAAAARNVSVTTTQNDLTHSPRIPLGNSPQTPGPLKPNVTDVIARAELDIQGARQKVETLQPKRTGFWAQLAEGLKTLFVRGGWQFNSDSIVLLNRQESYEAAIDVSLADTQAFHILEGEWLALQTAWFDLSIKEVEIRQLETQKRAKEKEIAAHDQRLIANYADASGKLDPVRVPPVEQTLRLKLASALETIDRDLVLRQNELTALASQTVFQGLTSKNKAEAASADKYRALPPSVQPTLDFVERVLVSSGHVVDRKRVRAFRAALQRRLPQSSVPQDPYSPESRSLVLDKAWEVNGSRPSIPAPAIARDKEYALSLEETDRTLAIPQENLLYQAKQSPEQARLGFSIQRFWELIDTLRLSELRQWTFKIYGKLGLDLPIQIAARNQQPVDTHRTDLQIQEQKDLIAATQALLDKSYDTNDKDVKTARDALQAKRIVLVQLAEQSFSKLDRMTDLMETQITEPAMQFEELVFKFEIATLESEKAYQRLHYLIDGRTELRRLLDKKRDVFLVAKPDHPSSTPAHPSIDRPDLTLPKPGKAPKQHASLSRPAQIALTVLASGAAVMAHPLLDGPLVQPSAVPDPMQWLLIGGLMAWTLAFPHLPHLFKGGSKERPDALRRWLIVFALMIASLFPGNTLLGLALGFVTAFLAWLERPQSITRHTAYTLPYWGAFTMDRRKFLSHGARFLALSLMVIYALFPTFQGLRDVMDYLVRRFSSTAPAVQAVSIKPIRIPLSYTPIESGELVRVRQPEGDNGVFSVPYLVRWIGPNDAIPDDSVFVFRSRSGVNSMEDQIVRLEGDVRTAQARVETARRQSDDSTLRTAQADLSVAQSRVAAVRARLSSRAEPMPTGVPLQVDSTWSMAPERTPVTAGVPLVLAYQKASYSAELPLIVSPEQALAIGTGLLEPDKHIRMRFERRDGGKPIIIPVQAIQQLDKSTEGESGLSALSRDTAKGGFAQFRFEAAILITDDMLNTPGLVDQNTLDFLSSLNSVRPHSLPVLDLTGFEEHRGTRWIPYRESLDSNEVVGLAELQTTAAPAFQASAPQETATVDVSALQNQLAAEKAAEQNLTLRLGRLPRGDAASEDDRRTINASILDVQTRIHNLELQIQHDRPTIRMTAEQGVSIGPRQLETVEGGRWIFARRRWARMVSPWAQRNPSRGAALTPIQNGAMAWDPQALDQVRDGSAEIVIRSALQSPEQISLPKWEIYFAGQKDSIIYDKTLESAIYDPVMGLSRIAITKAFSLSDARRLMPRPGSILPVKLRLPASAIDSTPANPSAARPSYIKETVALTMAFLAYVGYRVFKYTRKTIPTNGKAMTSEDKTDYLPTYVIEDQRTKERNLHTMDTTSIKTLSDLLRMTYFSYEHRDAFGRELDEDDLENIQFGHTGLEPQEAKTLVNYEEFLRKKDDPNKKTWQSTGIWIIETLLIVPLFLSDRAFETLRTAYLGGTPLLEILRTLLISRDWSGLFQLHTLLSNPTAFLDFYPFFVFMTVLWLVVYQVAKNLIEKIGGTWSQLRMLWFKKVKKVDVIRRKFLKTTAEISRHGTGIRPGEAIARVRKDPGGLDDATTALELHDTEEFLSLLRQYGQMLSERVSQNLLNSAKNYMDEKPEALDRNGTFDTEARKKASDARWWATILRETARYQGTSLGLIPPGTPLDKDHIQFEPKYLEIIAEKFLGMKLTDIGIDLRHRIEDPKEVERRLKRIHAEYLDRALVYWAIEETRHRPISTVVALETFDMMGLPMRATGRGNWDRRFWQLKGDIKVVLDEFRLRLPTLSKRAHQRRSEYSRQVRMFQMIHYLSLGFSKNDRLNPTLQQTVRRLVVDPKTNRTIIRERSDQGVPTFESLAFEFYLTGVWPEHLANEIRIALQSRRGFSAEKARAEVEKIKDTLDRENTRLYMAWLVTRRMLKDVPENFNDLLETLRYTSNRDAYDIRFLMDPAPIMDANKENHATNADLLMANLRDENLFEELMGEIKEPIFGDVDFFGDPALEINLREAAVDLGILSDAVGGRVQLTALSEALDPFVEELSERITTRLPGPKSSRIHVLTYNQADALLPKAGQRRENSMFLTAVDPGNFSRVVDPDLTDDNIYIIAPPSPYLKFAALLIYFYEVSIDRLSMLEKIPEEKQAYFRERLEDIRAQLERMNVRVRIVEQWDETIMTQDTPSETDDNSYNTIHIIFPKARRLKSTPTSDATFPLVPGQAKMTETTELPTDAAHLLTRTRWGQGGKGAIYRVLDGVVIPTLEKGFFLLHDEYKRLLALRYFHKHEIEINGVQTPAIYHSWTTSAGSIRRKGMAAEISKRTIAEFETKLEGKGIAYCNVEADNTPSWKNLEKRGYQQVGEFATGLFSHLNPKPSPNMRPAKAADKYHMLELLQRTYEGYLFTDFDPVSFEPTDGYYVWEENGQILAVINVKKQHWVLERLLFSGDKPLIWLFKRIPGLRRIFNLGDFWFLKLGNVAYEPGQAKKAVQLIEAAMADKKLNDALGYFDKKSPVYSDLKKAGAFGPTGFWNGVQETKVRVYAYAFDSQNKRVISELHQDLKNESRKPAFYAYKNLMWWLAPFAGLLFTFFGVPSPTSAATMSTLASLGQISAIQQTTTNAMQVFAQAGDGPWSLAQRFLGSGAHYQEMIAANPEWVKAGAKVGKEFLFHPGSPVNIPGLSANLPSAPSVTMLETPLSSLAQWLLHIQNAIQQIQPELFWIAAVASAAGILYWLWKRGTLNPTRRPWLAGLMGALSFAQSVPPVQNNPAIKPPSESIVAPSVPSWTMDPEARTIGTPTPEISDRRIQLNRPPTPLPIGKKDKKAVKEWTTYVNARINDAKAAHEAISPKPAPLAQAGRAIAANDLAMLKELTALLQEWKAAVPPSDLSSDDAEALNQLTTRLALLDNEAAAVLDSVPEDSMPGVPEVEQLRMEYLAIYAQRKGEIAEKPAPTQAPQKPTGKRGFFMRLLSPLKRLAGPAKSLGSKAAKPLGIITSNYSVHPMDPRLDALRKRTEDLIRTVKRNQILAHQLLKIAEETVQKTPEPTSAKPDGTEERLAWLKARFEYVEATRQLSAYRAIAQAADQHALDVRTALERSETIGNLPEADRFENVFEISTLWDQIPAGSSQLANDLVDVETNASKGIVPVKGTEGMSGRERRETLEQAVEQTSQVALAQDIQTSAAQANIDEQLALSQHLRYLGLEQEAVDIGRQSFLSARDWDILPSDSPLFRESQRTFTIEDGVETLKQNPALYSVMQPIIERAEAAAMNFQDAADKAAALEKDWFWKSKIAKTLGLDPLVLFPKDRAPLLQALRNEAEARAALKAEELALSAANHQHPGMIAVKSGPLLAAAKIAPPDDHTLESLERVILTRHYSLDLLHTVTGRHAEALAAFWQALPWPTDEWTYFASLVETAQKSMPTPKNTRADRLASWLTTATWIQSQLAAKNMTPGLAVENNVPLTPPTEPVHVTKTMPRRFQPPPQPVKSTVPVPVIIKDPTDPLDIALSAPVVPTFLTSQLPAIHLPLSVASSDANNVLIGLLRKVPGATRLAPWYGITSRDEQTRPLLAAALQLDLKTLDSTVNPETQINLMWQLADLIGELIGVTPSADEAQRQKVRQAAFDGARSIQTHQDFDFHAVEDKLGDLNQGKIKLQLPENERDPQSVLKAVMEILFPTISTRIEEPTPSPMPIIPPTASRPVQPTNVTTSVITTVVTSLVGIIGSSPEAAAAFKEISSWFTPNDPVEKWLTERYDGTHFGYPSFAKGPIHIQIFARTIDLMSQVIEKTPDTLQFGRSDFQLEAFKLAWRLQQEYAGNLQGLFTELDTLRKNPGAINLRQAKGDILAERAAHAVEEAVHHQFPPIPARATVTPYHVSPLDRAA